jgi:ERCC4-type nuclease
VDGAHAAVVLIESDSDEYPDTDVDEVSEPQATSNKAAYQNPPTLARTLSIEIIEPPLIWHGAGASSGNVRTCMRVHSSAGAGAGAGTGTRSGVTASTHDRNVDEYATDATDEYAGEIVLLVDERERSKNNNPLGIYLKVQATLKAAADSWETRRATLQLADFAWARTNASDSMSMLDVVIERKRMGDLVGRSSKGDHIEQLRRLALHKPHIRRPFFLLEEDPRAAGGWVAYNGGHSETTIESTEDVFELLAQLFIDERLPSKVIQSADIEETATTLVRITGIIGTQHRSMVPSSAPPPLTLKEFNAATKKGAATKLRDEVKQIARASGATDNEAQAVAIGFGSSAELEQAFCAAAPSARSRLLCPLLYTQARPSCDSKCCDLSDTVFRNCAAGSDTLIASERSARQHAPAALVSSRQCRMAVSARLAKQRPNMQPPAGWEVVAGPAGEGDRAHGKGKARGSVGGGSAGGGGVEWMLVRAEQDVWCLPLYYRFC